MLDAAGAVPADGVKVEGVNSGMEIRSAALDAALGALVALSAPLAFFFFFFFARAAVDQPRWARCTLT